MRSLKSVRGKNEQLFYGANHLCASVFVNYFYIRYSVCFGFYYSVLKRIKMYFQVEKELEWVLQENDIGLQQLRREQAMQQQRCAQKQP